ncbi:MAG: sulfurtransferase-like selenium metabolism protein YedF [Desulfobulbaceae bacterium]|nr:sulfurtransferase-like selenium metabolism protein YedF [Desulfobulbaceae bacterium]
MENSNYGSQGQTKSEAKNGGLVIYINSDVMGRGDDQLGANLMGVYLDTLANFATDISHVILVNSGVKLACKDSASLEQLENLAGIGIKILSCGTCINYFELKEKLAVGAISNMVEIIETMKGSNKVLNP